MDYLPTRTVKMFSRWLFALVLNGTFPRHPSLPMAFFQKSQGAGNGEADVHLNRLFKVTPERSQEIMGFIEGAVSI